MTADFVLAVFFRSGRKEKELDRNPILSKELVLLGPSAAETR